MWHIAPTWPPSASPMPTRYRPIWVRRLRNKSVGTFRTCPSLPPTISDNFDFWVSEPFFDHFRYIQDLAQNVGMAGIWLPIPPPRPLMYRSDLSKARPEGRFRPPNTLIGQKLSVIRTGQYEAFLTLFLAMFNPSHENVRC